MKAFATLQSVNDSENAVGIDSGVSNKFSWVGKFANTESANNKHWLCLIHLLDISEDTRLEWRKADHWLLGVGKGREVFKGTEGGFGGWWVNYLGCSDYSLRLMMQNLSNYNFNHCAVYWMSWYCTKAVKRKERSLWWGRKRVKRWIANWGVKGSELRNQR